jgi:hypothetical protein
MYHFARLYLAVAVLAMVVIAMSGTTQGKPAAGMAGVAAVDNAASAHDRRTHHTRHTRHRHHRRAHHS